MEITNILRSKTKREAADALLRGILQELGLRRYRANVIIMDADGADSATTQAPGGVIIVTLGKSRDLTVFGTALAHEMIHVKQIVSGKYRRDAKGRAIWNGKMIKKDALYLYQPWEVQAFRGQELLFRRSLMLIAPGAFGA